MPATCELPAREHTACATRDARGVRGWVLWLLAIALLTLPLFAHGCHGDDIDHEPLVFPHRDP